MPPKSRKKTLDAYIETTPIPGVEPVLDTVPGASAASQPSQPPQPPGFAPPDASGASPPSGSAASPASQPPEADKPSGSAAPPAKRARTRPAQKKEEKPQEHVIVQLPISAEKIHQILNLTAPQPASAQPDPLPYSSLDHFSHLQDTVQESNAPPTHRACFWCCHDIGAHKYGMPILYDAVHQVFQQFGTFCSLECAAAHNFATHQGSDKVWEIHSWIQLLAKKLGIETPIRPAPTRFLLQLFGGPMTIDDFRQCHKSLQRAYVMNIPPMINVSSQTEVMNISYILHDKAGADLDDQRNKLTRKKALMDSKRTLDSKMNLSYEITASAP